MSEEKLVSLETLVGEVREGASLAVPREISGVAMAATRALIRRGVKELHLINVPTSGLQSELLIGAGCVAVLETSAVSLGEAGPAPRFTAAVRAGTITLKEATCPAIHAALQAGEKGVPFMPLRGVIGSDIERQRPDWRVIDNPFAADDPILVLPALRPDLALFHAPLGDRFGNLWVGRHREVMTMAHAAHGTIATVEALHPGNLMEDPTLAPGTLPDLYVNAVALAPRGAWPHGLDGHYEVDWEHLKAYAELARSEDGFTRYLEQYVLPAEAAA